MLADLQNSDFIGWKENIMFLDNAWTELYQSLINHGDKTFLQEFSFSGNKTYLPDDFYQLYYVSYYNGTYEQPIARKAKTSTGQGPYYDIVGNELIVYRDSVSNLNQVRVQYYPVHQGITYKAPKKYVFDLFLENNTDVDYIYKVEDSCENYALANIFYKDDSTGTEIVNTLTGNKTWLTRNGDIIFFDVRGNIDDFNIREAITSNPSSRYFKNNNRLYKVVILDTSAVIYHYASGGNFVYDKTYTITDGLTKLNSIFDYGCYGICKDTIYFFDDQHNLYKWNLATDNFSIYATEVNHNSISPMLKIYAFNDDIYYESYGEGIFKNGTLIQEGNTYFEFNSVSGVSLDSGYGIILDNNYMIGVYPDTELSFPNNFYYNYLAYKLAIYYKIKQGADPSGIMLTLSEAEKTFYDTLPRDENNFVRIANAYAY